MNNKQIGISLLFVGRNITELTNKKT